MHEHHTIDHSHGLPEILTVKEVAQLLRLDRKTVYQLFKEGKLAGGKRLGRNIRFLRDVVISSIRNEGRVPHSGSEP